MKLRALIVLLPLPVLSIAGCQHNYVRATPPSVAAPPPAVRTLPPPEIPTPMPEPRPVPPLRPLPSPPEIEVPAPPVARSPLPAPAEPPPARPKGTAPVISPQMSPSDLAEARRQTNADISVSERNLRRAYGRTLDAAQRDLADKVRGFLGQSHDAIAANDWVRARNLAQKARILSDELSKSL
jgi:outer membrane biosynthesis protein TonB